MMPLFGRRVIDGIPIDPIDIQTDKVVLESYPYRATFIRDSTIRGGVRCISRAVLDKRRLTGLPDPFFQAMRRYAQLVLVVSHGRSS